MKRKAKVPKVRPLSARQMGKLGGKRRAERMSPEQRSEAAKKAAQARWKNSKKNA